MAAKLEFAYNLIKIPLTKKAQFFSIYITILLYYLTVMLFLKINSLVLISCQHRSLIKSPIDWPETLHCNTLSASQLIQFK